MRRLATAILHAGGRCAEPPRSLGGPIASLLSDVLPTEDEGALELPQACATVRSMATDAVRMVVTALAEIAVAEGQPSEEVRATFTCIARALGLSAADARLTLETAIATRLDALVAETAAMAAAGKAASRDALDLAYLQEVMRFDPVAMAQLGAEFAALAVHRLSDVTLLYELEASMFDTSDQGGDTAYQTPGSNPRGSGVES